VAVVDLAYNLFTINDKYVEAMQEKWAFLLMLSNSTLNSLIYFWQNKALRVQAKTFITKTAIRLKLKNPGPNINQHPLAYVL
jgi:hypothetical protein